MRFLVLASSAALMTACVGPPLDFSGQDASATADAPGNDSASGVDALADGAPPDAIPIDGTVWDADLDNPHGIHFTDVTHAVTPTLILGGRTAYDAWGVGSGAAVGDVDGDGDLDVIVARNDDPESLSRGGPSQLLRNISTSSGIAFVADTGLSLPLVRGHGAALGDIDRDGDLDAFIAAEGRDWLMENDGAGNFADITFWAGVAGRSDDQSVGAVFADVNQDGVLDLYVYNQTIATPPFADERAANRLYLNLGDGTFADISEVSGTDSRGSSQTAVIFDMEMTGDPVIIVVNDRFFIDGVAAHGDDPDLLPGDTWYQRQLITAEGVPIFANRAVERGLFGPRSSMGAAIADLDQDLTPDLYISDWGRNDLFRNGTPGAGALTDATDQFLVGVARDEFDVNLVSWGVRFVDLDRDGMYELFVVNGALVEAHFCEAYHQLDWLLRQTSPGGQFEVITASAGFPASFVCFAPDRPVSGRGAVFGDYDGDGDDDLIVTPYVEPYRFYRNDTPPGRHELRVRLIGRLSGADPIGATLQVTKMDGTVTSRFHYGGGDTFSMSDGLMRLGLGDETTVLQAVVKWPSGLEQRIDGLPELAPDATMTLIEPDWLSVEPRVLASASRTAVLSYRPVDATGAEVGIAAAGRTVVVTRSDGHPTTVVDHGDGTYSAELPHPGVVRRTVLTVTVDGVTLKPRPMIDCR